MTPVDKATDDNVMLLGSNSGNCLAKARDLTPEQYNHLKNLKAIPREARHSIQGLTALIASLLRERRKADVLILPGKREAPRTRRAPTRQDTTWTQRESL